MSPILVLDAGNSRMKWGLHSGQGWVAQGATPNGEIGALAMREWQSLPRPARVVGVNVAGEAVRLRIETALARWRAAPVWLTASAAACGVVNGYATPEQLGADRWAALVAARGRVAVSELFPAPVVVVNVGTAVTIDTLDGGGRFCGGVILPGLRLMLQALAHNTAALKTAPGTYQDFPTNTADALYSGAVQAICGAIELARGRMQHHEAEVKCLLAGGAAAEIAPHLSGHPEVAENLVLEGVLALAQDG
jgi:type III pantothenate kinase